MTAREVFQTFGIEILPDATDEQLAKTLDTMTDAAESMQRPVEDILQAVRSLQQRPTITRGDIIALAYQRRMID